MARKTTTKSNSTSVIFVKNLLIVIFAVFAVYAIENRIAFLLTHSELFAVKEIVLDPAPRLAQSKYLTRLKGKNIFLIDLKKLQSKLNGEFPDINDLRVFRKFPDKLFVLAKKRDPFAELVMGEQRFVLDQDGVVLSQRLSGKSQLPSISGVQQRADISLGEPVSRREIGIALQIIKSVRDSRESYKVTNVDVQNLSKIDFLLSNDVRIIVDQDDIEEKTRRLSYLLSQQSLPLADITYIDLRFKEPILGKNKI